MTTTQKQGTMGAFGANKKFWAGFETALADARHGMPLADMRRVPQPDDDEQWAIGYRSGIARAIEIGEWGTR